MPEDLSLLKKMITECRELQPEIVGLRRDLHQIPELGEDLPLTAEFIRNYLDGIGVEWRPCTLDSGTIAEIRGEFDGPVIALRADIDALPVEESTDDEFCSRFPGRMHACGHDAHAAMLLGAAKVLSENRDAFRGMVRLLFQAGEEIGTGAQNLITDHAVDDAEAVFGLHIGTLMGKEVPSGKIGIVPGNVTCYKDKFCLKISGKGCHGAKPHEGIDPITIASHVVVALEELFAREVPAGTPAVLTFGSFQSGSGDNAIPSEAILRGSMRTKDPAVRDLLKERMEKIIGAVTEMYRGTWELIWLKSSAPVHNDEKLCKELADLMDEVMPEEPVLRSVRDPLLGSDDFTHFAQLRPSVYAFLSSSDPAKGSDKDHHSPLFRIDEDVLWKGCGMYCAFVHMLAGKQADPL
ncbi:MAG: amidohydrolase [Flexilinea sp.]|nr:amidohydrolase [Flexilinea sp.]